MNLVSEMIGQLFRLKAGLMMGMDLVVDLGDGDGYLTCVRLVLDTSFDADVGHCRMGCDAIYACQCQQFM